MAKVSALAAACRGATAVCRETEARRHLERKLNYFWSTLCYRCCQDRGVLQDATRCEVADATEAVFARNVEV